jgi:hypothetical protein
MVRYQAIQLALAHILKELSVVEEVLQEDLRSEIMTKRSKMPKKLRRILETIRSEAEEGRCLCLNAIMVHDSSYKNRQ